MSNRSKLGQFRSDEPSMTVQSFRDEHDIGRSIGSVMGSARPDPRMPKAPLPPGTYAGPGSVPAVFFDHTQYGDFQQMQNRVVAARNFFESMPLKARQAFSFRPENLVEALLDPKQVPLLRQLGLLPPEVAKQGVDGAPGKPPAAGPPAAPAGEVVK